ncbi:LysR family transcriptional regulator [Alicyclobacillus suci]|uniref:LysR family transcriptional regulator n=1 Tax=Alicyclobacillus suci TaxID=2816080 RepID=UPI001A8CAFEF|nr:LysR family transcriptional regulator [Alicyclobacillus suci]
MEIHQLEYFLAVSTCMSFSTASMEINVSQSTLSHQIRKLENELGVKLFIREPRSVRLSPAGEEFLEHTRKILAAIKTSQEAMQQYTNYIKGHLSIGAIPTIAYLGFNRIITKFIQSYPGISVEIHEANTDDLLQWMYEKRVNVSFITSPFVDQYDVTFHPLVEDTVVALVPASHRLANSDQAIDIHDLYQEKFLMIKSSSGFRSRLIEACNDAGFHPDIILESSHVEILRGFVEEQMGVALMGLRIAQNISSPLTSIVHLKQIIKRQNGLAIPRVKSVPLATRLFLDFIINGSASK